jgi:nucleotide-binding universal stress UspA family protein
MGNGNIQTGLARTTAGLGRWWSCRRAVLVGVDGSLDSLRGVSWAARCAQLRAARLVIVQAGGARHSALAAAAAEAARVAPLLEVRTVRTLRSPVPALRWLSRTADLLVVARRGRGGQRSTPIGGTASLLLQHARCSVAAVPVSGAWDPRLPVVVGLDGSTRSKAALAVGLAEARRRGVALVVVHTCIDARVDESAAEDWRQRDWERAVRTGRALLTRQVERARAAAPGVRVDELVRAEEPTRTLLDHAERAQLLVLGARGRGGFAGLPAGSTATALFASAPCPVVVVRAPHRVLRRARAARRHGDLGQSRAATEQSGEPAVRWLAASTGNGRG